MPIPHLEPTDEGLAAAVALIRDGQLVGLPTETVYGLAADATNAAAVARIFAAKGRPAHNPLIVHVSSLDQARDYALVSPLAERAAARFWPGPLTMVLPLREPSRLAPAVTAGLQTVALRQPAHPVAAALLARLGGPLAAPSANPSGRLSPTCADHVAQAFSGSVAAVVDGGPCEVGLESTIVDLSRTTPVLLRPGALTPARLRAVLGALRRSDGSPEAPTAPGQLLRHYAPRHPVRLNVLKTDPGEAWVGLGPVPEGVVWGRSLSESGSLPEAASRLFALLHELDQLDVVGIAVGPIPDEGVGIAINDRLVRAAYRG